MVRKQAGPESRLFIHGLDQANLEGTGGIKLVQSILQGKALAHHTEDEYYATLGAAAYEEV
jgi:hypothetical protein